MVCATHQCTVRYSASSVALCNCCMLSCYCRMLRCMGYEHQKLLSVAQTGYYQTTCTDYKQVTPDGTSKRIHEATVLTGCGFDKDELTHIAKLLQVISTAMGMSPASCTCHRLADNVDSAKHVPWALEAGTLCLVC